jgi:hypothetical protein
MPYSLDSVKYIIEEFVQAHQQSSLALSEKGSDGHIRVNRSIFDIESFLVDLRKTHQVNSRLDTSIVSENILQHFNSIAPKNAFQPADYQLNFLNYLAHEYSPRKDLYILIDGFIEKIKSQLCLPDIVITKTGVTRCKTNTRFAINSLRDLGLILSRDKNDKRTWSPSIAGLVVLLNIRLFSEEFSRRKDYKSFDVLVTVPGNLKISSRYKFDPTIIYSLRDFSVPTHIYEFLMRLKDESLRDDQELLQNIIEEYIEFVQEGLEITNNGIRITKVFKQLSEKFLAKLLFDENKHRALHARLYAHFHS